MKMAADFRKKASLLLSPNDFEGVFARLLGVEAIHA